MDADGFVKITDFGLCKEGDAVRLFWFQAHLLVIVHGTTNVEVKISQKRSHLAHSDTSARLFCDLFLQV